MTKKLFLIFTCFVLIFSLFIIGYDYKTYALESASIDIYVIYDEDGNYLFEREDVSVGDEYIDKNLNEYRIYEINFETKTGKAKFIKSYKKPTLADKAKDNLQLSQVIQEKKIGIYMTHNDESYISGDGTESIYGAGGIHDISKSIRNSLLSEGVTVTLDETLHIPHDYNAYSRSRVTALNLFNQGQDAIFDIHRDGASRSFYVTRNNNEEKCMVRIVIGKANPNYEANKEFALFLFSVANEVYPWLFVDIYMASGHYNQSLNYKCLLFEMGSHLVEKSLVLATVPALTDVITTALYGDLETPTVEENEPNVQNPTETESTTPTQEGNTTNDDMTGIEDNQTTQTQTGTSLVYQTVDTYVESDNAIIVIFFLILCGFVIGVFCKLTYLLKK